MYKDAVQRKFAMPYGKLLSSCERLYELALQQQSFLLKFGITNAFLDEFHDKIELIKHLKDDSIRRNETSLQVREQAALTKNLRILLQQTLYRARMAFGDKSVIVGTFRGSEISQLRGHNLVDAAGNIIAKATMYQAELSKFGQTADDITAMTAAKQALDAAWLATNSRKDGRMAATPDRTEDYNQLFAMAKVIAAAGKSAARENNEVAAELYRIYDRRPRTPQTPDETAPKAVRARAKKTKKK